MKSRFTSSISLKILLWIFPPVLIAITMSVVLNNHFLEQELVAQAEDAARTYSEILRESMVSMMTTNYKVDESFLRNLHTINGIDSIRIVLGDLRLREEFATEEREIRLEMRRNLSGPPDSLDRAVMKSGKESFIKSGDHFRATIPFTASKVCQKCHEVQIGHPLGAADIHVTLNRLSESIQSGWSRSVSIFLIFLVASLAVGVLAFRRIVTEPVESLVWAAKRIGQGKFDRPVTMPESRDEMWILATAFEEMRNSLRITVDELAFLNRELGKKNKSLLESFEILRKAQDELIQSERLSAIGKMASSIIHDFKNPMTIVLSYAERLKVSEEMSADFRAKAFDGIARAIRHMQEMTSDLLDFSRGQIHLNMESVPAATLIDDVKESVQPGLEKKNVVLDIQQNYHGNLNVDVSHFRRALINIITNAQEAMPRGGRVTFQVQRQNGYAEFKLSDTGMGIPAEIRDTIFDAFVTHGKAGGTGLGLAITKLVVTEHGGKIQVQSEPGHGTTFSICIPLTPVQRV